MSTADRELVELVKSALVSSLRTLSAESTSLAGYALCTDDGLSTLYAAWITKEQLEHGGDPDLLFMPTDWPDSNELEFVGVARELRRRHESTPESGSEFLHHVDSAFAALVAGLAQVRRENLIQPSAFLSVLSTDPSDHLERLEQVSVEVLNGPDIRAAWQTFVEKWRAPQEEQPNSA